MNKDALIRRLIAKCRHWENLAIDSICKIDLLENRIKGLQESISDAEDRADHYAQVSESNARRARDNAREAEEQRSNAEYAQYKQQEATRDLERARSHGDEYGAERALEHLKFWQR